MPLRTSRDAPKFVSAHPTDVRRYFEDLEQCSVAADLDDAAKILWAVRYPPGTVEETWSSLDSFSRGQYEAFKAEVLTLYPGATSDDRRYSLSDLEALVNRAAQVSLTNRAQFGEYYREFNRISSWLLSKERISKLEQRREFMRGFDKSFRDRILARLLIKVPNHFPHNPYDMPDVVSAVTWLLTGTSADVPVIGLSDETNGSNTPVIKSETTTQLASMFEGMTSVLKQNLALYTQLQHSTNAAARPYNPAIPQNNRANIQPVQNNITATWSTPNGGNGSAFRGCIFCGGTHFVMDCADANTHIQMGYIKRNAERKLVLPNGQYVPGIIQGANLKERVLAWHLAHP
ncbi:hypothetical protein CALVIDRAFT_469468, partial [Calocera viscosa TUFC12733]